MLRADGDLVLYRTQVGFRLWASNAASQPVSRIVMEPDGSLVDETAAGRTV